MYGISCDRKFVRCPGSGEESDYADLGCVRFDLDDAHLEQAFGLTDHIVHPWLVAGCPLENASPVTTRQYLCDQQVGNAPVRCTEITFGLVDMM
jgi:hypothetical protein